MRHLIALLPRADAEPVPVEARKMTCGRKAGSQGDVENRKRRLSQQLARVVEPHVEEITLERGPEVSQKQALQVPARNADAPRQGRGCQRLLVASLDLGQCSRQRLTVDLEAGGRLHALRIVAHADIRLHEPLADLAGEFGSTIGFDELTHEIKGRNAARARQAVSVDLEQGGTQVDIGKRFAKGRNMLPMDGTAIAVHDAGPSQQPRSARHSSKPDAAPCLLAKPGEGRGIAEGRRISADTNQNVVERFAIRLRLSQHEIR